MIEIKSESTENNYNELKSNFIYFFIKNFVNDDIQDDCVDKLIINSKSYSDFDKFLKNFTDYFDISIHLYEYLYTEESSEPKYIQKLILKYTNNHERMNNIGKC